MRRILQLVVALSLDGFQCGALIDDAARMHKELAIQAEFTDNKDPFLGHHGDDKGPFQDLGHQADDKGPFQDLGHKADNKGSFQDLGHQADDKGPFQDLGHKADNKGPFLQELTGPLQDLGNQADNTLGPIVTVVRQAEDTLDDLVDNTLDPLVDNTLAVVEDYYTWIRRKVENFFKPVNDFVYKPIRREARSFLGNFFTASQLQEFRGDILIRIFEWFGLIMLRLVGL